MMRDNNNASLSNLSAAQRLEKLLKLQEELASNKVLREAKSKQVESKACTAINPII